MAAATSEFWRVIEGGFPACPPGTVVVFVNDGASARIIRTDGHVVGTIHQSTTRQTVSADGATITLVNESEGWRTVLSKGAHGGPATQWQMPDTKRDPSQWTDAEWHVFEVAAPQVAAALRNGGRFVVFPYCISLVFLSLKQASPITFVQPGKRKWGIRWMLVSLVLGWWGIPWGPWWTIRSIHACARGGIDVNGTTIRRIGQGLATPNMPGTPPR